VPTDGDSTEMISTHRHRTLGGRWYQRILPPINARTQMERELRALAARCESDLLAHRPTGQTGGRSASE
jgi:hypothetical protein